MPKIYNGKKMRELLCICECGNRVKVTLNNLRKGHTKSCGCLAREEIIRRSTVHGMYGTPAYKSWVGAKARCYNPRNKEYKNYGGRGIKFCERWEKFKNFLADMGQRPSGLTLDRINNDKGYSKKNCRWATRKEQANNRRNDNMIWNKRT